MVCNYIVVCAGAFDDITDPLGMWSATSPRQIILVLLVVYKGLLARVVSFTIAFAVASG